jgi:hypothetical protein
VGVLKVRVNGVWEEIGVPEPPLDEVWVGAGPPDPVGTYEIWVDNTVDPAVLHFQNQIGEWHEVDTGNEVTVGTSDPYDQPNCVDELWVDTRGGAPGILKVRLGGTANGHWEELVRYGGVSFAQQYSQEPFAGTLNVAARADHQHGTPGHEVVRGDTAPTEDHTDLWWNTSLDPPVLMVREGNTDSWVPVDAAAEPPLDEVWVGPARPDPVGTYEVWYDTSTLPGKLFVKREGGEWEEVSANEVVVAPADPYLDPAGSKAELWHNTAAGQNGKLYVRIPAGPAGQWRPVTELAQSEVEVSASDPKMTIGSNPAVNDAAELWIDTNASPIVLKAWVNGAWQMVSGPDVLPAPQEVEIGPATPREVTVELWYDTTNSPKGTLRANNNGVWEDVGGANEVTVGNTDPYVDDPLSEDELWYDTSAGVPGILYVRTGGASGQWVPVIQAANSVNFEQNYGDTPDPGSQLSYSRSDHTHGTPPPEVWVGDQDPYTRTPVQPVELWYDTSVA